MVIILQPEEEVARPVVAEVAILRPEVVVKVTLLAAEEEEVFLSVVEVRLGAEVAKIPL